MNDIEMRRPELAFEVCHHAAGVHLQSLGQDGIRWLKATPRPPFLEHLSFRLGNQVFFVRLEDVDGQLPVPGSLDGLLMVAEGWNAYPCLMPMEHGLQGWRPLVPGWGLIDARTGHIVDPFSEVSGDLIEMTDWELQDFAVQVVRDVLIQEGREIMSHQSNPTVNPSIWFVGDQGPEWVVVRVVRYPLERAERPANWATIHAECSRLSSVGRFASVSVASSDERFHSGAPVPLWRGHAMVVSYKGLEGA